jgi:DNA-binding transcriptional ArsR family regulator
MADLSDAALDQVAHYFKALSEPMRLKLLNRLRDSPANVGELAQACGCTMANASKHLSLLAKQGIVCRSNQGTHVYYQIANQTIYALCDLVCGSLALQIEQQANWFKSAQTATE